jgi:HSP20 family protein
MLSRRFYNLTPWEEMNRMQREINRLFSSDVPSPFRPAPGFPAMNIWTSEEGAVVTAEVPGIEIKDLEISVVGETLSLSGERKADEVGEDRHYHRQERGYGEFSRTIELPFPIEANKVEAVLDKGILTVTLPRTEAAKPKKIIVKVS